MTVHHSYLDIVLRAIRGEPDVDVVFPAVGDQRLAYVIALASDTHHVVRTFVALLHKWTELIDPIAVADPAFHAALLQQIETIEGRQALDF